MSRFSTSVLERATVENQAERCQPRSASLSFDREDPSDQQVPNLTVRTWGKENQMRPVDSIKNRWEQMRELEKVQEQLMQEQKLRARAEEQLDDTRVRGRATSEANLQYQLEAQAQELTSVRQSHADLTSAHLEAQKRIREATSERDACRRELAQKEEDCTTAPRMITRKCPVASLETSVQTEEPCAIDKLNELEKRYNAGMRILVSQVDSCTNYTERNLSSLETLSRLPTPVRVETRERVATPVRVAAPEQKTDLRLMSAHIVNAAVLKSVLDSAGKYGLQTRKELNELRAEVTTLEESAAKQLEESAAKQSLQMLANQECLSKELDEARAEIARLKENGANKLLVAQENQAFLSKELDDARAEAATGKGKIWILQEAVADMKQFYESRVGALEQEIGDKNAEVDAKNAEVSQMIDAKNSEVSQLREQISSLQQVVASRQEQDRNEEAEPQFVQKLPLANWIEDFALECVEGCVDDALQQREEPREAQHTPCAEAVALEVAGKCMECALEQSEVSSVDDVLWEQDADSVLDLPDVLSNATNSNERDELAERVTSLLEREVFTFAAPSNGVYLAQEAHTHCSQQQIDSGTRFAEQDGSLLMQNRELLQTLQFFQSNCAQLEAENTCLKQIEEQLERSLDQLGNQHAGLLGHNNHKQKIHYTVKLKEENAYLRTEFKKVRYQASQLFADKRSEKFLSSLMVKLGEHAAQGMVQSAESRLSLGSTDGPCRHSITNCEELSIHFGHFVLLLERALALAGGQDVDFAPSGGGVDRVASLVSQLRAVLADGGA